jgi:AAA ATPase domain
MTSSRKVLYEWRPNPFRPGVGKSPPYLADRDEQLRRFRRYLNDFPENRRNVRVTGLRGVGKTVLLKEYRRAARSKSWIVVRRDVTPRLNDEADFALAVTADLESVINELSVVAKLGKLVNAARAAVTAVIDLGDGVSINVTPGGAGKEAILEDRLRNALFKVGQLAAKARAGVLFLYDEAHVLFDRPNVHQFPLSALLGAFVQVQDYDDDDLPVMLVICGLPPLITNLQAARSHSERLFKVEELGNLSLEQHVGPSPAAAALTEAVGDSGITFPLEVAEQVATDVSGYPYFIQWYGEALWDAAEDAGQKAIDVALYEQARKPIQAGLDVEFFEGRYDEAKRAEQLTLRVAGSLGAEGFRVADLTAQFTALKPNAVQQSINRLAQNNLIFRVRHGQYAYTAPLFGDFLRRRHPRHPADL